MSEPPSPQLRRDRRSVLGVFALVPLALQAAGRLAADDPGGMPPTDAQRAAMLWLVGTFLGAAVVPLLYWSPYRTLGLVPLAAVAWLAAVGHGLYWNEWPAWAHGAALGVTLFAALRDARGPFTRGPDAALGFVTAVAGLIVPWCVPFAAVPWLALAASLSLVGWTWARLFRPLFELACEPFLWVMYRVRPRGPGFADFPRTGPCLVIANHACWLDPIFLIKVLPRPLTPMMTAKFYDLPLIRPLMVRFGVIRVPERALKKDAPEVLEAVAALDRGECVVIFPEGYLRRSEDRPLRRFGQGVWQILKARPGTPVFAAWIEGGWGSYTSHRGGPPVRGRKPDVRRRIGVGLSAAVCVPPDVLAEHLRTRTHLMNLVSAARAHLELDPLPPFELPAKADDEGERE